MKTLKAYECKECGNLVMAESYPTFPKWSDGHTCYFVEIKENDDERKEKDSQENNQPR
jgi:hypothetical protein